MEDIEVHMVFWWCPRTDPLCRVRCGPGRNSLETTVSRDVPRRAEKPSKSASFSTKNHRDLMWKNMFGAFRTINFTTSLKWYRCVSSWKKMLFQPDITRCLFCQAIGVASGCFETSFIIFHRWTLEFKLVSQNIHCI